MSILKKLRRLHYQLILQKLASGTNKDILHKNEEIKCINVLNVT